MPGGGIVALEFSAAITRLVTSTLLPVVACDPEARDQLALLAASTALGFFVALPLSARIVRAWGTQWTAGLGIGGYVGGLVVAATLGNAWGFALGQFLSAIAGGLLAIFGLAAAITLVDDTARAKIVAFSASMWFLPALIGPAATLGLDHLIGPAATLGLDLLIGRRWTLLFTVCLSGHACAAAGARQPDAGARWDPETPLPYSSSAASAPR